MRTIMVLVLGIITSAPGLGAEQPAEDFRMFGPETTLADVDLMIDSGKQALWNLPRNLPADSTDRKQMEEDLAEFVFTDESLQRIDELRAGLPKSLIAGSDRIQPAVLAPLEELLRIESCRMSAVAMNWSGAVDPGGRSQPFEEMLTRLPEARREEFSEQLAQLGTRVAADRKQLIADVGSCESLAPGEVPAFFLREMRIADSRREALRRAIASAIDSAVAASEIRPLEQERLTTCPPANPPTPGMGRAQVRKRGNIHDYYPAGARNAGMEGRVRVRIEIDGSGCVRRAAVVSTSGYLLLDQAAMRMAFDYEFIPAEENGKARERDAFIQPLTFSLRDEPTAPQGAPPQPQP